MTPATSNDAPTALKSLRDTLRNPTSLSSEDLAFHLSSALESLHLHPTSVVPSLISSNDLKGISRYLPAIQGILLNEIVPTFLDVLDDRARLHLKTLFVPPLTSDGLSIRRQIALVLYNTLPGYLSLPKTGQAGLVKPSREFLLDIMAELVHTYSIDDLYFAIYGQQQLKNAIGKGKGKEIEGRNTLAWEEAVRSCVGIPAKVGNAIGRWNSESPSSFDVPTTLEPKPYFDRIIKKLEGLMYELSQNSPSDTEPIRLVIEKLCSIGLLTPPATTRDTRSPSLFPALLPPLLKHLHPAPTSPLRPYPADYLPSIFLALPSSLLASFVESLLDHLTLHLIDPANPLLPNIPDKRIKRSVEVLTRIIGMPKQDEEAWNAVIRSVLSGKAELSLDDSQAQARNRLIAGWIASGGDTNVKAFIENIIEAWTDPKYVKFALYGKQFNLTHILVLSLGLLPAYLPWLVALSHRSKLIMSFQAYLSHPDASIRRLGMLVAEMLSELTIPDSNSSEPQVGMDEEIEDLRKGLEDINGDPNQKAKRNGNGGVKRLKFTGIWEGDGEGREECRWLRSTLGTNDARITLDNEDIDEDWLLGWKEQKSVEADSKQSLLDSRMSTTTRGRFSEPKDSKHRSSKPIPKPKPKIVMLDPDQLDDPMEGYDSPSPASSRSPSPTPSYLDEVAADPSLALDATQKKKVHRPVYIPQLVALLKERDKPESIEMGLKWGESLIRAKREFGTELAENAVAATLMTLGLNDPFNLEGFEEKRQGIMNALVACSPKEVAPFLCEQYFNNQYSLQQKSVILTALAMGARELAGLSIPEPTTKRIDFPSKTLPPSLHKKYLTLADIPDSRRQAIENSSATGQLENTISDVRNGLLSKGAKKGDDVPEVARERRLKVGRTNQKTLVAELGSLKESQMLSSSPSSSSASRTKPVMEFKDIAAEVFILPLINRFWQYYNDFNLRQSRSVTLVGSNTSTGYRGTGGGMIMSPIGLEKLLITLSILLNASRHSSVFLGVLAPETLELALTLGLRFMASSGNSQRETEVDSGIGSESGESLVISASLELSLVVLNTAFELDKGRSLFMDKPELILGVGEWATTIFQNESSGDGVSSGQGGLQSEGRIKALAAATVLKVGEIGEKWGGLGLGTGMRF
ncbi:uncharacterized protein I303_107155 [Kwoniella dejecticola CBS 10117]|uniref:Telomere length regulation protein conserved domain-containing protein n=1 Tax=Kwoniella dejecticola CBS 10117 TaxID=1296121 RepID=A0A1A5ZYW2_9TREE|nr:uncharacterized protein I303_06556 [Kwoniella dejecticola CBS 10117]OBR82998.1 hypothetical protein I303_06556 [Kwoniella dejecticola CBS 10117]